MGSKSVAFAVADEDLPVLAELVKQFGGGNRSEFLRQAMRRMRHEAWAAKMRGLQSRVHAEVGRVLTREEIDAAVKAALAEEPRA
jgi:Arc/MetJ-type ribon-helix-helix transcriptional regulator